MFIKLYQFNKNNDLLTQFKKSLKVTQDFVFNVFTKVKNEIKANKDIQKCVDKSKHLKDIVVLDSNIKEAPTYVAKHTDKKVLIIPRTKNNCRISFQWHMHTNHFTIRCSPSWISLIRVSC